MVCRLESQVLGQEHSKDAAQVVHGGRVEVGLSVGRCVPHSREGRGDEVEHRDPWRGQEIGPPAATHSCYRAPLNPQPQKIVLALI